MASTGQVGESAAYPSKVSTKNFITVGGLSSNSEFPNIRRSLTVAITLIWLFLALGHDTPAKQACELVAQWHQSPMFYMQHNGHRLVDYCMDVSRWLGVDVDDRKVVPRKTRKSVRSLSNAPRTNFSRNAPMNEHYYYNGSFADDDSER